MGKCIKENQVLVAGIVLPVLLVAGFLIMSHVNRAMLTPPEYDFVIAAYRYVNPAPYALCLDFQVKDGRLWGRLRPAKNKHDCSNRHQAALYRYDADDHRFEEIIYDLPDGLNGIEKTTMFPIEAANNLILDRHSRSNDGYTFKYLGYRGGGGLLGEIFGMRRRHKNPYVLSKNGAYFHLPTLTNQRVYHRNNVHFLGWILPEGEMK